MAPMEAPAKADALSRPDLELALKDRKKEELMEMAKRLQKSHEHLAAYREELVAEQQALREEGAEIKTTIEFMLKETQKLRISSDNTGNTPGIDEGPLDFVGRLWDRVKPRDTAVQVSEHVGELKRAPQAITKEGNQVAPPNVVEEQVLNWWQQGQALAKTAMQSVQEALPDAAAEPSQNRAPRRKDGKARREKASAPGGVAEAGSASTEPVVTGPIGGTPKPVEAQEGAAAPSDAAPPAAPPGVEEVAEAAGEQEDALPSTILIEAKITLGDGTTQTLHVTATQRVKEVAQHFVRDHSLKPFFVEPLTSYLKKVEADAERFPVSVQADLMEIHSQFSKGG